MTTNIQFGDRESVADDVETMLSFSEIEEAIEKSQTETYSDDTLKEGKTQKEGNKHDNIPTKETDTPEGHLGETTNANQERTNHDDQSATPVAGSDKETETTENVRERHESVSSESTTSQTGIKIPKQATSINTCNVTIRKSRNSIAINPTFRHCKHKGRPYKSKKTTANATYCYQTCKA